MGHVKIVNTVDKFKFIHIICYNRYIAIQYITCNSRIYK